MAAEVKWIKIVTDVFEDEKMLLIDGLPERDSILVIWFKLLCLAGKQNNGGVFLINQKIPYTDEMLSTAFRRPLATVRLALEVFCRFGMVEIIENVITVPNWDKHQRLDTYEQRKESDRIRQARRRERQKRLLSSGEDGEETREEETDYTENDDQTPDNGGSTDHGDITDKSRGLSRDNNVTSRSCHENVTDTEKRIKNKDITKERKDTSYGKERSRDNGRETGENDELTASREEKKQTTSDEFMICPFSKIVELYHTICVSYPKLSGITANRKNMIGARWKEHPSIEKFEKVFRKAEGSSFLKGSNERGWIATFDWMMKADYFGRILEGYYDDRKPGANGGGETSEPFDYDRAFKMALKQKELKEEESRRLRDKAQKEKERNGR